MPHPEERDGKTEIEQEQLKEVDIEDLLPRDKIEVDMDAIGALLKDKKILITGAAGSIGSEIVRQAAAYHPAEMILTALFAFATASSERRRSTICVWISNESTVLIPSARHSLAYSSTLRVGVARIAT